MKKILTILFAFTAATVVFAAGGKEQGTSSGTVTIGIIQDTTGATATLGKSVQKGVEDAIADINASGGIAGKQVKYIEYDTAANVDTAIAAYIRAVTVDQVDFLFGPPIANIVSGIKATTASYGVPMITFAVDPKCYTDNNGKIYEYLFCAQPSTVVQGQIMAEFAIQNGFKKFGVFYTQDNSYSVSLLSPFVDTARAKGATIENKNIIGYNSSETDIKTLIQPIIKAGVDAIYCPNYPAPLVLIKKACDELGYKGAIISGLDGSPAFNKQVGSDCSNVYYINNIDVYEAETAKTIAERCSDVGAPNKYFLGYDSMRMAAKVMAQVGTKGADVAKALSTAQYDGLTGTIKMDPATHMPVLGTPMFMYKYDGIKPVMLQKYPASK
ncbi:ABC transporter substrate-binding protein [Treponema parvum]|uniref:ABC transporter substrate-binding protein n=1 Tax=Treponema parvum TaxID=138851 RepID=A0A975F0Y3_9SPIR|nr:ABC transporter substrate-binding protein [Treponema parvum]QTQ12620.1 ABC transporter substrate-binding protein [Treponema parvum]